jgi:hypothetical protein
MSMFGYEFLSIRSWLERHAAFYPRHDKAFNARRNEKAGRRTRLSWQCNRLQTHQTKKGQALPMRLAPM